MKVVALFDVKKQIIDTINDLESAAAKLKTIDLSYSHILVDMADSLYMKLNDIYDEEELEHSLDRPEP